MSASAFNAPRDGAMRLEQPIGSPSVSESAPKSRTLLVVEDEETLREIEVMILRSKGFHVLESGCVAGALELAAARTPIHLLLTDRSLPDGNGLDLARRFRKLHPQAPIILSSGSLTETGRNTDGLDRCALMPKPFQFGELLELIGTLLAEATQPIDPSRLEARPSRGQDAAITG